MQPNRAKHITRLIQTGDVSVITMAQSWEKGGMGAREWCHTSVSGFVTQQHLHLPVLLQRLQQDIALLVEEEEERQCDVVRAAAVSRHLEQGSRVAAASFVVILEKKETQN